MGRKSSRGGSGRVLADKTNAMHMPSKRVCVYSKLDASPAKKGRRASRAEDVYHFETDGKEEPRVKKKKKKPAAPVKRLQRQPAVRPKKRQQPPNRAVSHAIKPPPRPRVQNQPALQLRANFAAHVPAALRKEFAATSTPVRCLDTTDPAVPDEEPPATTPTVPTRFLDSSAVAAEEPPLERLFEDECPLPATPTSGPTRFEWRELAEARARVARASVQRPGAPAEPAEAPQEAQRLKQTSILSFVSPPAPLGSSTPVRPSSPEHCSMLSPRKDEPEPSRPTRLTLNTLKQVIQASKDAIAQQPPPPSPKRHFNRPPRKSYEKLSKKKALDFLELENEPGVESEPEELFDNENEPESEDEEKKAKKKQRRKRQDANSKALDEWAKKFNMELKECEEFDLAVE